MNAMYISVIIPTWNRRQLLAACLDSLAAQTFRDFEIIVVDDGSTDGTAAYLADAYPHVRVVSLARNSGFATAINAGIRQAQSDWLFLLNNDMTLEPSCMELLADAASQDLASLIAPLVLCQDQPQLIYGAGDRQYVSGRPEAIGHGQPVDTFVHPRRIFGVSAGAALYDRSVFERIGLFDESFGAYFEDSDLNFRAKLAGFRACVVPEARAYHLGSASLNARHLWRARQCCRNHLLLVIKNMPTRLLYEHSGEILAEVRHQNKRVLAIARAEGGLLYAAFMLVSVWLSFIRRLPHALMERVRIQRRSRQILTPGEVDSFLMQETPHD